MLGRTHFVFGILLALLYYYSGAPLYVLFVIPLATLFMDVDEEHSYVGRKLKFIGKLFSHRGFFHSIWFLILSYLIADVFSSYLAESILIAYASHMLLDGVSKAGINPLWPFKWRVSGFVRVGEWEEHVFLVAVVMGIFFVLV